MQQILLRLVAQINTMYSGLKGAKESLKKDNFSVRMRKKKFAENNNFAIRSKISE